MGCVASSSSKRETWDNPDDWTTLHSGARKLYDDADALDADWSTGAVLGEGTFARVEVVTKRSDPFEGATFARKTYGLERYVDAQGEVWPSVDVSALAREINILQNVGDPRYHVMQLFGVLETPAKVHLILEQCDEDLLRYIAGPFVGGLPECAVARYSKQLLTAVAHCHGRNVMHRKIALEDLLIRHGTSTSHHDAMEVCLGDFGHATAFVPGKTLKRPKSSPVYASPEEILTGVYTEKIDVWACGIAIMSLVGGLGAFEAKTYLALHSEGVAGALALRAHARSPELVAFLEALLERDAAKRTSAAGALAAHATWLAGSPTPCPVLTDPPSDGSSARRLADFHVRARAQLARVNLQRAVNRGLRRAPSDEVDVLACAVRDDNKARNARRAAAAAPATSPQRGPSTPTRRPSATFRKSVQMVIVANREAKVKFVDEVLGRDDVLTVAQLREAIRQTKLAETEESDFADIDDALAACENDETIVQLELSSLVTDHRAFFQEQKTIRAGSKQVRFAYDVQYISSAG